jgi:hypothetical protein
VLKLGGVSQASQHGISQMNKFILIALTVFSTAVFANQNNVYEDFKHGSPTPNATAEEEVTAQIKRYMASLLYPVDMSSLNGPDKDAKFRDLIIVLQQQMGVSPTGVLTTEQFLMLQEASRYVDGDLILNSTKHVLIDEDGASASGTGMTDAGLCSDRPGAGCDIGQPLNFVRIFCFRARGVCERWVASFDLKDRFLFLDSGTEYNIDTWTSSRVTATEHTPCATFLMTIDGPSEQVTIATVPQPSLSSCKGFRPPAGPSTWNLVDGLPVAQKVNRDRMNAARALVYPPARRLLPIQ